MNIIVCYTPLHALIAASIMDEKKQNDFFILYIAKNENSTHRIYFEQVTKSCNGTFISLNQPFFFGYMKYALFCIKNRGNFSTLITGNIKHFHSRLLCFFVSPQNIETHDDGSGHISGKGYFYSLDENKYSNFIFSFISRKNLYKNIIKRIRAHYTIYKFSNWADTYNVKKIYVKIKPFSLNEICLKKEDEVYYIYIGNAFSDDQLMSAEEENALDDFVVNNYNINCYIPHPRRKISTVSKVLLGKKSNGEMISEELVFQFSNTYKKVIVIGSYSTVLLNVCELPNVNVINIDVSINKPTLEINSLLTSLGAKTIKFSTTSCEN